MAVALGSLLLAGLRAVPAAGPLAVCADNPRWFAGPDGRALVLVGSHTWNSLQDCGPSDPPPAFDWPRYLNFLAGVEHNFVRLWRWELTRWQAHNTGGQMLYCSPHPWPRTGPGTALDGKPKFDLSRFDPAYFDRLRERVESAGRQGIYVSVMLFEGWGMQFVTDAWQYHPYHPENNVNGLGGEVTDPLTIHELVDPAVTANQEAYVRKVIETVGDLDNVLYEISNENHPASTEWQYHLIRLIKQVEAERPKQHPVGMTFQYRGGNNQALFDSPADWISPNPDGGYRDNPPAANGTKVVLNDTDHLWGIGGNGPWVWRSFLRGLNPIFMDEYDGNVLGEPFQAKWDPIRRQMGYARRLAERLDLARMTPRPELASTGYCLAGETQMLVYQPEPGAPFTVKLPPGAWRAELIDARTGESQGVTEIAAAGEHRLEPPGETEVVLLLWR